MATSTLKSRALRSAATHRIAASSVASVLRIRVELHTLLCHFERECVSRFAVGAGDLFGR